MKQASMRGGSDNASPDPEWGCSVELAGPDDDLDGDPVVSHFPRELGSAAALVPWGEQTSEPSAGGRGAPEASFDDDLEEEEDDDFDDDDEEEDDFDDDEEEVDDDLDDDVE